MAARVGSCASATWRAEPAVSAAMTALRPSLRMVRRHWPSAWTWLSTVLMVASVAPGTAISWWRTGRKCSPMMCRPEVGIRWWMSATRPATEFSIGIMPSAAEPSFTAASASSKVGAGSALNSGKASWQAICELAPGSPWNTIVFWDITRLVGWIRHPAAGAGAGEVGRHVDAERHGVDEGDVDAHPGLQGAELLQPLAPLQRRGRKGNEAGERRPPVGVEPDMVIERPRPGGRGGAGEIERAQPAGRHLASPPP